MAIRLYWPCWAVATGLTGIVAGFMVGHTLLLGRFLSWMIVSGRTKVLNETYPVFAQTDGRPGLALFYALCGLQVAAGLVFLAVALVARRQRLAAALAGLAGPLWPGTHFGSGFGRIEQTVLRSVTDIAPEAAGSFVTWNGPIHAFHAAALLVALGALLAVPLREIHRMAPSPHEE